MPIVALAGGVGASKLLLGLSRVMEPRALTIVVNTADDLVLHGLAVSPDLDIVTYTLAGVVNPTTGWGRRDETFSTLEGLAALGRETWFCLGDRDLATHIHRTALLRGGATLSEVTDSIRRALRVRSRILPMSDQPVRSMIETNEGEVPFQEYFVKRRSEPVVRSIRFDGIDEARPAPGVLEALDGASAIVVCPSNPVISIGPILAVPGIREGLRRRRENTVAVCPLVGGKSLKGPSDRMMRHLGYDASAFEIARLYQDIAATFVIDPADAEQSDRIEALGLRVRVTPTVMKTLDEKENLARSVLNLVEQPLAQATAPNPSCLTSRVKSSGSG